MLKELLQSNSHYGYLKQKSLPKNFFYLYGFRHSRCIINLENTVLSLKCCFLLLKNIIKNNNKNKILFVLNDPIIKHFSYLFKNKKENILLLTNNWKKSLKQNNDITLIIMLNNQKNQYLLNKKINIPIISIVDTNNQVSENIINYPVMINEKNLKSLFLFIFYLIKCCE